MMERRDFLKGILAAASAPAFIKADRLMRIALPAGFSELDSGIITTGNRILTFDEITREALRVLHKNISFIVGSNAN